MYALKLPPLFKYHNIINVSFIRPYQISTKFPRQHPDLLFLPLVRPNGYPSDFGSQEDEPGDYDDKEDEFEVENIIGYRKIRQTRTKRTKQPIAQQLDISTNLKNFEFLVK